MWKNYLTAAVRNLWKYRFYTAINIFGLSLGLACFLFIMLFVHDEWSFDRFHERLGHIYRVDFDGRIFGQELIMPEVGAPFGPTVVAEFPEVENQVRLRTYGSALVRFGENSYREEKIIYADSSFFDIFSFGLHTGESSRVLSEPNTVVISAKMAQKYFGRADPIGKLLIFDGDKNYRISGIMHDMPANSHIRYDFLVSLASSEESRQPTWTSFNFHTYLLLRPETAPEAVEAKFDGLTSKYLGAEMEKFLNISLDDFYAQGNRAQFLLTPLSRIHLHSHLYDELSVNGDIKYVYIFSFIGLFILLLACINFMNLSTARSATRAREVGMRKVVGAGKTQLMLQFLTESVLLSFISLLVALAAVFFLLPEFNQLAGKSIKAATLLNGQWLLMFAALALAAGLLAGTYPAFVLSAFRPIFVLKGQALNLSLGGVSLRNALVVFQFVITIALVCGTLVINRQLQFIQQKKLGFERHQVLVLKDTYSLGNQTKAFKEHLLGKPEVISASYSSFLPTPSSRNKSSYFLGRSPDAQQTHVLANWYVDEDYIRTLGMEMSMGRNFDARLPADSNAVIINEAAAKIFKLGDPLGQEIGTYNNSSEELGAKVYRVIGVVRDFHYESLREQIAPLILHLGNSQGMLALKISTNQVPEFIQELEKSWKTYASGEPFSFDFLDDRFRKMYETELRIGRVISLFTGLAIFIACLGLFGLATFLAQRRTKEIGIRKVLGAPAGSLFLLLLTQFTRWVLIACILGLPMAYFIMHRWLDGFAYRTNIPPLVLVGAAAFTLFIALLTVSFQALRALRADPVKSLKYE